MLAWSLMLLTLLLAPTLPLVTVGGQAGQVVTLTVRLPDASTGVLLNREAPNTLTLQSPWATVQATPTGRPFQPPRTARAPARPEAERPPPRPE